MICLFLYPFPGAAAISGASCFVFVLYLSLFCLYLCLYLQHSLPVSLLSSPVLPSLSACFPHSLIPLSRLIRMPGGSLLSHGESPHYHRHYGVSLLSSVWFQVVPPRSGRQANSFLFPMSCCPVFLCSSVFSYTEQALCNNCPQKLLRCCKVKPHGSLVPVSSARHHAYTSGLLTSSSSTSLQDRHAVRENSSQGRFRA